MALFVPLSLSIEISMMNDEVSCNLLLLLAVLNGSVSQIIYVFVISWITHRVVPSRKIDKLYLGSRLSGKFVPSIIRLSPPAGFMLMFGETLVICQSTTSAVTEESILT